MKAIGFKASPEIEKKLRELFAFYGVQGEYFSDQMREFIDELSKKLFLCKNSLQPSHQQREQKPDIHKILCKLIKLLRKIFAQNLSMHNQVHVISKSRSQTSDEAQSAPSTISPDTQSECNHEQLVRKVKRNDEWSRRSAYSKQPTEGLDE